MTPNEETMATEIIYLNERLNELEKVLNTVRSQLYDKNNQETILTDIIDITLKNEER